MGILQDPRKVAPLLCSNAASPVVSEDSPDPTLRKASACPAGQLLTSPTLWGAQVAGPKVELGLEPLELRLSLEGAS